MPLADFFSILLPENRMAAEGIPQRGQHLSAKDSLCRDRNRVNNAVASVGTGTSFSMASAIIQRPSPESCTSPFNCSSRGSSFNGPDANSKSQERTTLPCIQRSAIFVRLSW